MTRPQIEVFGNLDFKRKIVPKGRRLGATFGAAVFFLKCLNDGECPLLWGDTIHSNIDRYVERYFTPIAKRMGMPFKWEKQKRTFHAGNGYIDFRSADNPENWEGFGYKGVFLNESGIILKNRYLWDNAVQPMMLDYPDSWLIAMGTPKGKMYKGQKHPFFDLYEQAENNNSYWRKSYSTFDNPFIRREDIDEMISTMPKSVVRQEIYGEFIDTENSMLKREYIRYGEPPEDVDYYFGVDLAVSQDLKADYTSICVIAVDEEKRIYIVEFDRFREHFHVILQRINNLAKKYSPKIIAVEKVQAQAYVIQELLRNTTLPIKPITPDKKKEVRFYSLLARYEGGLVYHTKGRGVQDYENEVLDFPDGEHDDMVDSAVYAYHVSSQNKFEFILF